MISIRLSCVSDIASFSLYSTPLRYCAFLQQPLQSLDLARLKLPHVFHVDAVHAAVAVPHNHPLSTPLMVERQRDQALGRSRGRSK